LWSQQIGDDGVCPEDGEVRSTWQLELERGAIPDQKLLGKINMTKGGSSGKLKSKPKSKLTTSHGSGEKNKANASVSTESEVNIKQECDSDPEFVADDETSQFKPKPKFNRPKVSIGISAMGDIPAVTMLSSVCKP
jgi:hypothetical protein